MFEFSIVCNTTNNRQLTGSGYIRFADVVRHIDQDRVASAAYSKRCTQYASFVVVRSDCRVLVLGADGQPTDAVQRSVYEAFQVEG